MKRTCVLLLVAACTGGSSSGNETSNDPVAHDDHLQTPEDKSLSLKSAILSNDENASNRYLSIVSKPMHGTVSSSYGDDYVYYPEIGYHGPDHFEYQIGQSTASVDIDVQSDGIPYERGVLVDGGPAISLVTGDLNGDGKVDLAAIDTETHSVVAMLNRSMPGNYQFDVARFEGGHAPASLVLSDVDGDGKLDVVTAAGTDGIVVMRNTTANGTLSFAAPVLLAAGNATSVTTGDIDQDGHPDLISTDKGANQLIIRLDRSTPGTIAFDQAYAFATAKGPIGVQAVDIDHTGGLDVVVLCETDAALSLFSNATAIGDQVPAFAARVDRETSAQPGQLLSGDLDGDGSPELVVVQPQDSTLRVFNNTGSTFAGARVDPLDITRPTGAGIVDLDHAGGLDLVVGYGDAIEQLTSGASYSLTGVEARVGSPTGDLAPAAASTILQVELDGVAPPEIVIASDHDAFTQGKQGTMLLYGD
ncbi:MAG: VCBS repeat-containing protein [Deltaproteobacteria bacterium]|nr:VCBS repeat-containing protein [Deltaproteobacteria bacterium]